MSLVKTELFLYSITAVLFYCGTVSGQNNTFLPHAKVSRILSPESLHPVKIKAGDAVPAVVILPFDLTPPPGVQRPRAWKKWSLFLYRTVDAVRYAHSGRVRYRARIMRIRPSNSDNQYIIYFKTLPWMPVGMYTIRLNGPGFVYESAGSVSIGSDVYSGDKEVLLEVVAGGRKTGVAATAGGKRLKLLNAVFADSESKGDSRDRLLQFAINKDDKSSVKFRDIPPVSLEVAVKTAETHIKGPLDWQTLYVQCSDRCVSAVWDFKDGDSGFGQKVSHRWMFSKKLEADVTVFDVSGVPHSASVSYSLARVAEGCQCGLAVGADAACSIDFDIENYNFIRLFFDVLDLFLRE
jgi:hypothetical protein